MSTIRDVAKRAGVAPITVSRVINNSGHVTDKTRERVQAAIRELNYVPNRLARSLRLKRTHTIALVVTDITNPFWTTVVRGAEDAAQDAGFNVILCNTDESEAKQEQYLDVLLQKRVDGILLVPVSSDGKLSEWLERETVPVVILDRRVHAPSADVVRGDSEGGAYRLARHLLSLGHRHIAVVSGPHGVSTAEDRVAGCRRALQEVSLELEADLVHYGQFNQESGYEMTQRVLRHSPCPTAVVACNNFIAIGAFRALKEYGLRVPEDVSVVAFDDLAPDLVIDPFLTVANQPAYEMGQRAAKLLLDRLSGLSGEKPQEILLPTPLIVRRSSAPARRSIEQPAEA